MRPVNEIVKSLYEQILSLHEFVDPHINRQFYLNRVDNFNQLPLLLQDMVFMFTNVSSKVRQLVLTIKPQKVYTLQKFIPIQSPQLQQNYGQVHTQPDLKKKLTINSMQFGQNNILRQRSINTKPIRKQRQSVQVPSHYKQNKYQKQLRQSKQYRQFQQITESRQKMFPQRLLTTIQKQKDNFYQYTITESDEPYVTYQDDKIKQDPYGDQLIYSQNIQNNINKKKDYPRRRKILSISIKSPNVIVN